MNLPVICINDSNKPNDIPMSKWVRVGERYSIVRIDYMNQQGRVLGCQLAEIDLMECIPHTYFLLSRFVPFDKVVDQEIMDEVDRILNK